MRYRRVKSGCRTCKIRKVKCDETRPSCMRCFSTGRSCDGYGIWTSPSTATLRNSTLGPQPVAIKLNASIARPDVDKSGKHGLEWFHTQAAPKLQGLFPSDFWRKLVLQASWDHPAIQHATVALGLTHMSGVGFVQAIRSIGNKSESPALVTLGHYSTAVQLLSDSISFQSTQDLNVTLTGCLLFVHLELLRGNIGAANVHLQAGLSLLYSYGFEVGGMAGQINRTLNEAFEQLHLQAALFGLCSRSSSPWFEIGCSRSSEDPFQSVQSARRSLDTLVWRSLKLIEVETTEGPSVDLVMEKQDLGILLQSWLTNSVALASKINPALAARDDLALQVLRMHHSMATIMTSVSLEPDVEVAYDDHAPHFVSILELIKRMRDKVAKVLQSTPDLQLPGNHNTKTSRSIADIGGIAPLYFVATKCRVHHIREKAIVLLEDVDTREGIWDRSICACIARKVAVIEEQGPGNSMLTGNNLSNHLADTSPLRYVPATQRLHNVTIEFGPETNADLKLHARFQLEDKSWTSITWTYNQISRMWD